MSRHKIVDVSDSGFDEEVGRSGVPSVVDFWAPWCEPCKLVHPILERLAVKYEGKVRFFRMNVDEEKTKPSEKNPACDSRVASPLASPGRSNLYASSHNLL